MKNKKIGKTGIEYGEYGWSPIRGCKGTGCAVKDKCWAKGMNKRFGWIKDFSKPEISYDILDREMPVKPSTILTCFMGDIFGEGVEREWKQQVFYKIRQNPMHTYFILTKHLDRITYGDMLNFPKNAYLGRTVNSQKDFNEFENFKGSSIKYWISFEPLLSDIKFFNYVDFKWFVIGGMQFGREPRPKIQWIENIVRHAADYNIPVFMKDNIKNVWGDRLLKMYPKGEKNENISV